MVWRYARVRTQGKRATIKAQWQDYEEQNSRREAVIHNLNSTDCNDHPAVRRARLITRAPVRANQGQPMNYPDLILINSTQNSSLDS